MTNNINALLVALKKAGIKLSLEEGRLRLQAPKGAVTSELQDQLRLHRADLLQLFQKAKDRNAERKIVAPIPKVAQQKDYVLSNAQRRLWVFDQLEEGQIAYNIPAALQLSGQLNIKALAQSFNLLFERHEVLRTNFIGGRQVIRPSFESDLVLTDYTNATQETIQTHIRVHATTPFDLEKDTLFKFELLKVGETEHILLLNLHHIISDGWSTGVIIEEFSTLYKACLEGGKEPLSILPSLAIQYKDYAAWQNTLLESEQLLPLRQYWLAKLAPTDEDLPKIDLLTDYPRPVKKTYNGAAIETTFKASVLTQLEQLAQSEEATLFMCLTALTKILLYRYTGQKDLIVGTPTAGRNHPDLEGQIGFYVNTLVLRNQLAPQDDFISFLKKVKTTTLEAFEHDAYPFGSF